MKPDQLSVGAGGVRDRRTERPGEVRKAERLKLGSREDETEEAGGSSRGGGETGRGTMS